MKFASPPLVIGSMSLKAHKKGLSKDLSLTHAALLEGTEGSSGEMGTRLGKIRAPSI
jgi:hypothetical protein